MKAMSAFISLYTSVTGNLGASLSQLLEIAVRWSGESPRIPTEYCSGRPGFQYKSI